MTQHSAASQRGTDTETLPRNAPGTESQPAGVCAEDRRTPSLGGRHSVREALTVWLDGRTDLSAETRGKYLGHIEHHILPALGDRPVDSVSPVEIERLMHSLLSRGLSPATVRRIMATLRAAYGEAIARGWASTNPVEGVEVPERVDGKAFTWSPDDAARFLAYVSEDPLLALWRLMLIYRIRRSEVLELHWSGVDLANGIVDMRAMPAGDARLSLLEDRLSTVAGDRFVRLDPDTRRALREHRRQQAARRLGMGATYVDTGLVFTHPDGTPITPWWLSRRFAELARDAGLPPVGLHELRRRVAVPTPQISQRRR